MQMSYASFVDSLNGQEPPAQATVALRALWYDARGESDAANRAARADRSHATMRVRAYLARKRGDQADAARWYWRSGATPWEGTADSEWTDIVYCIIVELLVEQAYV